MAVLVDLDAGLLDDLAPARHLVLEDLGEARGRAARRLEPVGLQALLHLRALDHLTDLAVQALDDFARQALRPDQAVPVRHLVARIAGLRHRRQIGRGGDALVGGDRERAQAPGLYV